MGRTGFCECGCGQRTNVPRYTDHRAGRVAGVPARFVKGHNCADAARARGDAARGNRTLSPHGYVCVTIGGRRRRYEHVLIAEATLGRPLRSHGKGHANNEVVHHIDGDKTNNARSNLLICTHAYHVALHARLEASANWPEFQPRMAHRRGRRA
jgi:hypothetical protein